MYNIYLIETLAHNIFYSSRLKDLLEKKKEKSDCEYFQGDYIWIEPVSRREFDVAIGAKVVTAEGRRIQVCDGGMNTVFLNGNP